jgi:HAD superfamily hydrolase (TIGR01549 family)
VGADRNSLRIDRLGDALRASGNAVPRDELEAAVRRVRDDMDGAHLNGVDRTFHLWVRQIVEYAAPGVFDRLPDDQAEATLRSIDEPFLAHPPSAHPDTDEILSRLTGHGLRIALISNTGFTSGETYIRWFEQLGLADYFSIFTFSHEAAVAKPTAAIFESTLEQLGVVAENALHVGDNLDSDVAGAHRVGMSTVWLRTAADNTAEHARTALADYTISDLVELPDVVERWLSV